MTTPRSDRRDEVVLDRLPRIADDLVRSMSTIRRDRHGALPMHRLRVENYSTDLAELSRYDHVCGFPVLDTLPATWLHVPLFRLHVRLLSGPTVPFSLAGLVHLRNQITVIEPSQVGDRLSLTCEVLGTYPHRRGVAVDLLGRAWSGSREVWRDESSYLVRGGQFSGVASVSTMHRPAPNVDQLHVSGTPMLTSRWRLPANLGRVYAQATGDYNPIHVSAVSARLFGFRRPIIHGMWTHARALSALGARVHAVGQVRVVWTRPIMLPSTVGFAAVEDSNGWLFGVFDPRTGKQAMVGETTSSQL